MTGTSLDHRRQEQTGNPHRRQQVHLQHLLPAIVRHEIQPSADSNPCIVYDNVWKIAVRGHRSMQDIAARRIAEVGCADFQDRAGIIECLVDRFSQRRLVDVVHNKPAAGRRELPHHFAAETAARPCDQDDGILEICHKIGELHYQIVSGSIAAPSTDFVRQMTDDFSDAGQHTRPGLLLVGALAGLAAAAWGMLDREVSGDSLSGDAVATVNGKVITRDQFDRSLLRQQTDSEDPLDEDDRRWVLQRLIEEELLVQRGLELGMAHSENEIRGAIVRSLVASVTAEADAANPNDAALQQWFTDNPERFTYPSALSVDAWLSDTQALARSFADSLLTNKTAGPPDGIRRMPGIPTGYLPPSKMRDYLGPGVTRASETLPLGNVSIYARDGRWLVVRLVDRQESTVADFHSVRTRALVEYRRMLADEKLRDYLDTLRDRADVITASQ